MGKLKVFAITLFTTTLLYSCGSNIEVIADETESQSQESTDDSQSDGSQSESDGDLDELYNVSYEIPIVFHILYEDKSSAYQNIKEGRIAEIMESANLYFNGAYGCADVNIQFVLATTDPEGNTLSEAGVDRVDVSGNYPTSLYDVMDGDQYKYIIWDPNEYINVMCYMFAEDESNILGISYKPVIYSGSNYAIDGILTSPYQYLSQDNLTFAYCASINANYIYCETTQDSYDPYDVNVTLGHELSHYLGLYHVYAEDHTTGSAIDGYDDTDYCEDTPTYNRIEYMEYLDRLANSGDTIYLEDLFIRQTESGGTFYSVNIMDYNYSYSYEITEDQKYLMRTVLQYALLMPGEYSKSKSAVEKPEGILEDVKFQLTHSDNCYLQKKDAVCKLIK